MPKRTLYYWARLYAGQLEEGNQYRILQKSIAVNILDFDVMDNKRYHNVFHVREDTTGLLLTDVLEIHFLELRKMREQATGLEKRLVRWMLFLAARTRERMEELAKEEPMMQKALTTLEFLSQDEQTRMLYEARQKALHDYASAIGEALEQGEVKGRMEGRMETARAMLAKGMDIALVSELTGLSLKEVQSLLAR